MGPICNDTVDYCATINCANNEPCVNMVEELRGICLCGALKAPVTCSKGMAYSVCGGGMGGPEGTGHLQQGYGI